MFMISLALIFGVFFTVFAVQNTDPVALHFGSLVSPRLPLYVIILGSLLAGVITAWLFAAIDNITTYFLLNKKEKTIRELKKMTTSLTRRVHQLEVEKDNAENEPGQEEL